MSKPTNSVEYERHGRVAVIRLVRGRLNVYARATHEQLCRAFLRYLRDDEMHCAVMTSGPGQSWSAGDDVKEFGAPMGDEPDWSEVLMLMPRDKPVVGAVRGYCLGQGLVYLLRLTDIRYAAPDARFGFPEIRLGIGGASDISGLTETIPPVVARHLALTGGMMDAVDAARHHLVNDLVTDDELDAHAMATANRIAAHPLGALRAEMSPTARALGGRNPYLHVAQFQAMWRGYADEVTDL